MGIIILRRRYAISKYLAVLMITVGILICTIVSGSDIVSEFSRIFGWPQTRSDFLNRLSKILLNSHVLEKYGESRVGERCSGKWIFCVLLVVVWHFPTCYRFIDLSTNGHLSRGFVQTAWQACTWSSLCHCKWNFSFVSFDLKFSTTNSLDSSLSLVWFPSICYHCLDFCCCTKILPITLPLRVQANRLRCLWLVHRCQSFGYFWLPTL